MSAAMPLRTRHLRLRSRNGDERAAGSACALDSRAAIEVTAGSNTNLPDAIRRAMAEAARVLATLNGASVEVFPQQFPNGHRPRYSVTLTVVREPR